MAGLIGATVAPIAHAEFPNMGDVILANGFDWPTASAGGSNYLWYDLGPDCERMPYGLLPNYHQPGVRVQAQQQLATMYGRGMRTLSIGVFFRSGISTGDVIDASVPAQVSQAVQNLSVLLDDIKAAGFERVLFRFFPQANMNPSFPEYFDSDTMGLYWQLVQAMHEPLELTSLPYKIDLGVELAPADSDDGWRADSKKWKYPADKNWSNAVRDLWRNYKQTYGTADSVGFSFLTATNRAKRRVRHMKYVYEGTTPPSWPWIFMASHYRPHRSMTRAISSSTWRSGPGTTATAMASRCPASSSVKPGTTIHLLPQVCPPPFLPQVSLCHGSPNGRWSTAQAATMFRFRRRTSTISITCMDSEPKGGL